MKYANNMFVTYIFCYTKERSMWCMEYNNTKEDNFYQIMFAHCLLYNILETWFSITLLPILHLLEIKECALITWAFRQVH